MHLLQRPLLPALLRLWRLPLLLRRLLPLLRHRLFALLRLLRRQGMLSPPHLRPFGRLLFGWQLFPRRFGLRLILQRPQRLRHLAQLWLRPVSPRLAPPVFLLRLGLLPVLLLPSGLLQVLSQRLQRPFLQRPFLRPVLRPPHRRLRLPPPWPWYQLA